MALPPPTSTTDVYLAAVIERLEQILTALTAQAEQPRRTRTPRKVDS